MIAHFENEGLVWNVTGPHNAFVQAEGIALDSDSVDEAIDNLFEYMTSHPDMQFTVTGPNIIGSALDRVSAGIFLELIRQSGIVSAPMNIEVFDFENGEGMIEYIVVFGNNMDNIRASIDKFKAS